MYSLRSQWVNGQQVAKCLMTLLLLCACVLSNCALHASEMNKLSLQISQQMSHQHECCLQQEPCCEGHVGVFNATSIDHNVSVDWQFDGFAVELLSLSDVALSYSHECYAPTGPPIHLIHCRFTI